jgi:hypothetical protein
VCVATVVDAPVNATRPRSAKGSWTQIVKQADGASRIHSAESVSGERIQSSVENEAPDETLRSAKATMLPATAAFAATVSPGRIVTGSSTGDAGKSWYQAE